MKRTVNAIPVLREVQALWTNFTNCRAHFPAVDDGAIGTSAIRTAPYYSAKGFDVWLCFPKPLTQKNVRDFLAIGHWINQNFIVRLCALLESRGVLQYCQEVDATLPGAEHVCLLRRLRNVFSHSSGRYQPRKEEHKRILKILARLFQVNRAPAGEFPLGIAEVLEPLLKGCKQYVTAWAGKAAGTGRAIGPKSDGKRLGRAAPPHKAGG